MALLTQFGVGNYRQNEEIEMRVNKLMLYGPFAAAILIGILAWYFKPIEHRSLSVEPPIQEVFGWETIHAVYVRNEANPQYDPEHKVVTVIKIDRDERKVSYDAKTSISNLSEVLAGLPNVVPLATFDGKSVVCTLDPELTYPGVGVFVFHCEYPAQ
jgi:hypothetical protein